MAENHGCDIFISYAREDLERARTLVGALESLGWSVFWDRTIPAGSRWREYIGQRLDMARCVVVGWSASSVNSRFVIEEAEAGDRRGVLAPVLFEDVQPPLGLRSLQAADLSQWSGEKDATALAQFVEDLSRLLGSPPGKKQFAEQEAARKAAEVRAPSRPETKQEGEGQEPSLPILLAKGVVLGLVFGALLGSVLGLLTERGVAIGLSAGLASGAIAGLAISYYRWRRA